MVSQMDVLAIARAGCRCGVVAVWCCSLLASGCSRGQSVDEASRTKDDARKEQAKVRQTATSVVQLLANPERYDGSESRVNGFLQMDRPDREDIQAFLHLNQEDADRMLGTHIEVSFWKCDEKPLLDPLIPVGEAMRHDRKYVAVTGKFVASPSSPSRVGVLCGISELLELPEPGQPSREESSGAAGRATRNRAAK